MFNLCRVSSNLLHCSKQSTRISIKNSWCHLAPLSVSNGDFRRRFPPKTVPARSQVISMFHTSFPRPDKMSDFMDDARKRYNHMLSQVEWKEVMKSPQPALVYGVAGLIPFVFPPTAILLNGAFLPNLAFVQLAYGASILSFLGGVKWGFALPENSHQKLSWDNLGQSVSFSLIAFGSLLLPPALGTITLVGGLGASAYIDITCQGYPQWFKAMRLCLTSVAVGSLGFGLVLRLLY